MKVILVSTQVMASPPPGYGGLEAVVAALAAELRNLGHEVHLVAPEGSNGGEGVVVHSAGKPGAVSEQDAMMQLIKSQDGLRLLRDADVVHDQSWTYAGYLTRIHGINDRVLHTHHGMSPWDGGPPPWAQSNLVGISATHAAMLSRISGRAWRFVHNGSRPELYPFNAEPREPRLLWLSRLAPYKGCQQAIATAEALGIPIDIVGGSFGDVAGYVQRIKEMCAASKVAKFVGEVDHATKVQYLQRAAAVLLPIQSDMVVCKACRNESPRGEAACLRCGSKDVVQAVWAEPNGLVAAEAGFTGTPLLVTANGGYIESMTHGVNGFFVGNLADTAAAWQRILAGELKAVDIRANAERRFTAKRMAQDYLRLYKNVVEGKSW